MLVVDKRAKRRFVISKSVWERPERTERRPGAQTKCATIRPVEGPDDWKSSPTATFGDQARTRPRLTRTSESDPLCFARIRARMCDHDSRNLRAGRPPRTRSPRTCEWNSRAVPVRYKIALPLARVAGRAVRRHSVVVMRRGLKHRAQVCEFGRAHADEDDWGDGLRGNSRRTKAGAPFLRTTPPLEGWPTRANSGEPVRTTS